MTGSTRTLIDRLTAENFDFSDSKYLLNDFANEMGWRPSSDFLVERLQSSCNAHILVEHGLVDAAMLTFMKGNAPAFYDAKSLLLVSYNNLTDWHIQIYSDRIYVYFNRTNPPSLIETFEINSKDLDKIHKRNFEYITEKKPNPNLPSLDIALIKVISDGKAAIHSSLTSKNIEVNNEQISAFFNTLILIRAMEDYRNSLIDPDHRIISDSFMSHWQKSARSKLSDIVSDYITTCKLDIPSYLINLSEIQIFDAVERYLLSDILRGLYKGQYYGYDFSVISKHSLSRIYEHYMSVLYYKESEQPYLLLEARKPEEKFEKIYGSIYTPQYVAKFFAEISENILGKFRFMNANTLDPACGSGIFLRNIAEKQLGLSENIADESASILKNIHGIDKNPNASHASRLSLALLCFSISGKFPSELQIVTAESLSYIRAHNIVSKYDIIIANPPYISVDKQDPAVREAVLNTLGELAKGRVDTYLGFLKSSIDALKPGGVGMFVIPQGFMNSASGKPLRTYITENCTIRYICDLSEIDVFPGTGAYVILLVLQKGKTSTPAIAMRALSSVGEALEDVITNTVVTNPAYSIFPLEQEKFSTPNWIISKGEDYLSDTQASLSTMADFFEIRQGFISGNDDVFIQPTSSIPDSEKAIWADYLSDREMDTYTVPSTTEKSFFMPYIDGQKIRSFDEIATNFPFTAELLKTSEKKLKSRSYLQRYKKQWWEPTWPRTPDTMLVPKIVTPQVVIYPRFSLDSTGEYSVSHSPFIVPKMNNGDNDILSIILPVLNSTFFFWWATNNSPKYRGGYYRLSAKVLLEAPIPNLTAIPQATKRRIIKLTNTLINPKAGDDQLNIQQKLDDEIFKLYGIDKESFLSRIS